ncbi:hypothetical protein BHM03_00059314 [Ensete ventricosum]|nr:hypothetical protein BHM03_00059314 [Ensete ventricosum]
MVGDGKSKVICFDLYRPKRAKRTNLTGYRYADRPLPDGTVEIGVSPCGNKAMRRCLLSPREDKAPPHLPAGERGTASSSRMGTRRRLVFQHENEAMPRLPTRG